MVTVQPRSMRVLAMKMRGWLGTSFLVGLVATLAPRRTPITSFHPFSGDPKR